MSWLLTKRIEITVTRQRTKKMMKGMLQTKRIMMMSEGMLVMAREENAEVACDNEDGCVVNYHIVIVTSTTLVVYSEYRLKTIK